MNTETDDLIHHDRLWLSRACVLIFVAVLATSTVARSGDDTKMNAFAHCLTAKKATMYGSFWCSHCDDQKKLFGSSFQYVNYVECSVPGGRQLTFACQAVKIRFTPTWIFADGERREGLQPLQQLSTKTGCPLP